MTAPGRQMWTTRRRRAGAILLVALVSFIASALPSIMTGSIPQPNVHDEFAYLLAADTFAHGRLANPPLPMWEPFETFHVIHRPTYAAKFPPGQGLVLAVGQVLGLPILGVWLSVAVGCGALTWMLLASMPPRWALLGGLLAAGHPLVHWWSQSYWGGGVALVGGAVLCGAALRAIRTPRAAQGALMGVGVAILANSRPFEGLILCFILAILMLATAIHRRNLRLLLLRVAPGAGAVLLPVLAMMAYYNWRVTGSPWQLPYALHQKQYMIAPLMFWQKPATERAYRHEVLRRFHRDDEYATYLKQTTLAGFVEVAGEKIVLLARAYLQPAWLLAVPLLAGASMFRRRRAARWAVIVCLGLPLIHLLCTPWVRVHYMAPAFGFLIVLATLGLWRLNLLHWRGWKIGRTIVVTLVVVMLILDVRWAVDYARPSTPQFGTLRASVIDYLEQQGGKHLVIVRYGPSHDPAAEWVFNGADLANSPVIFARDMGEDRDRELIERFADRQPWLLAPESPQPLTPLWPAARP